jgi:hypothetical protein
MTAGWKIQQCIRQYPRELVAFNRSQNRSSLTESIQSFVIIASPSFDSQDRGLPSFCCHLAPVVLKSRRRDLAFLLSLSRHPANSCKSEKPASLSKACIFDAAHRIAHNNVEQGSVRMSEPRRPMFLGGRNMDWKLNLNPSPGNSSRRILTGGPSKGTRMRPLSLDIPSVCHALMDGPAHVPGENSRVPGVE